MGKKFRILSLDGGGLRGIVPVIVLQEIEKRSGKRIHEMFDLIAGTSTGGLIACGLAAGRNATESLLSIDQIYSIYAQRGKEIFPLRGPAGRMFSKVTSLIRPEFSTRGIEHLLKDLFGSLKLMDCLKPVLIPSYDLYNNEAVFFKSRHAAQNPASDALLYDVCRATTAAPTYFPPYDCSYENKQRVFVDGGVFMNNPAVGSIVEISKYRSDPIYNRPDLIFDDICLLSLGTGHYDSPIPDKRINTWGELNWAKAIGDVMMQAVSLSSSYEAAELLADGQFLRLGISVGDKTRSDMADSSDATRDYLVAETHIQLLQNKTAMDDLDLFMKTAEMI